MTREELTTLIRNSLTRTDFAVMYVAESEYDCEMVLLYEVDSNGESLGEIGYEVEVNDDGTYSIHYLEMPWSPEPFPSFAVTSNIDELMAAINSIEFHVSGTK